MKKIITLLLISISFHAFSQKVVPKIIDTTAQSEEYWKNWENDLYDMGETFTKDSFMISKEVKKAMLDTSYRSLIYPQKYTWPAALNLMRGMEIKKALWYFIKLYSADTANQRYIVGTLIALDSRIEMDKALTAAYYTYGLADPEVCYLKNNKPEIIRPDIVQNELNIVRQLCSFIRARRKSDATER